MWKSIAISLFAGVATLAAEWQKLEVQAPHMGTLFGIVVYTQNEQAASAAIGRAFARIAELDQKLSDYKEDSELNLLCRAPYGQPTPVSADLYTVIKVAQSIAFRSDGAFDITVGPLVRLWRRARQTQHLPTAEIVATSRTRTGFRSIRVQRHRRTVTLLKPQMQLDLGGIAKGYAADQALAVLKQAGFPRSLVAASGDIRVGAAPPGKKTWRIALDPYNDGVTETIELTNHAVSTSGAAEQSLEIDGLRYSHILDPRTGLGLTTSHAVSVVASKGILADGWATALCVLGPERSAVIVGFRPQMRVVFHRPRGSRTHRPGPERKD